MLRRFWIKFDLALGDPRARGILPGCGVTAYDYEDMLHLLRAYLFKEGEEIPKILECIEDVDVSKLDKNHVLPNMGVPSVRGIWFPLGHPQPPDI